MLHPITGATLNMLRDSGKRLIFVTNNSTKTRAQYLTKFRSMGLDFPEVTPCTDHPPQPCVL